MKHCLLIILFASTLGAAPAIAERWADWGDYYSFERVPLPEGVDAQIGGIVSLADGRIAAAFASGEIDILDPAEKSWTRFAQGLQTPLGLISENDGSSFLTMQWSELTRVSDTDSDGAADFYQNVWNGFGVSGNYHEFAFGPVRDADGNLYVALNTASNGAGIAKIVRGPFSPIGYPQEKMSNWREDRDDWAERKALAGRMYARVPYRGCVVKITPEGKSSLFATGFRSPNGIGIDPKGRLWVTDNQGDWIGTSPLYHVEEGNFYGHPASLIWKDGWKTDPLKMSVEELDEMRTPPAARFPQAELANSPTQPIPTIAPELFGLPEGELIIGDMNQRNLIRFLPDEVDGTVQGTLIPFLLTKELGIGNHRFTFAPDGSLWIGKIHLKWAGGEGLVRVKWKGQPAFLVVGVDLGEDGFDIQFNRPLGKDQPTITVSRHSYNYHQSYGSPKVDESEVEVDPLTISADRQSIQVGLPEIKPGYLYTINVAHAADAEGRPLMGNVLRYNVVVDVKGSR